VTVANLGVNAGVTDRVMVADVDGDGVKDIVISSTLESRRLRWYKGAK
jgi:hypothetical protein